MQQSNEEIEKTEEYQELQNVNDIIKTRSSIITFTEKHELVNPS